MSTRSEGGGDAGEACRAIGPAVSRRIEAGALGRFARATRQTDPRYLDPDPPEGAMIPQPTDVSVFCNDVPGGLIVHEGLPLGMFLHTDDPVTSATPALRCADLTEAAVPGTRAA